MATTKTIADQLRQQSARLTRERWPSVQMLAEELGTLLASIQNPTAAAAAAASAATSTSTSDPQVKRCLLATYDIRSDYIVCTDAESGETVNVALPYALRITPFNLKTITFPQGDYTTAGLIAETSYSYSFTTRTVTNKFISAASGKVVSTQNFGQIILPKYFAGAVIYAIKVPAGTDVELSPGNLIEWLDLNADGRTWQTADRAY